MKMQEIWVSDNLSAYIAIAPEEEPTILSPTIKSVVLLVGLLIPVSVIFGADGLDVSTDSKTPNMFKTSGTFNDILSSWTLVPNG